MALHTPLILIAVALASISVTAPLRLAAQDTVLPTDPAMSPETITLVVSPAAEPVPAMRYELLPPQAERKPGNAATHYYRAVLAARMIPEEIIKEERNWHAQYAAEEGDVYRQVPREQLQRWIDAHGRAIQELMDGAQLEACDWGLRVQDLRGTATLSYTLEEFQQIRDVVRALSQKTHLQIEDGDLNGALESIRAGYQAGRDVAQPPILICGLVGIALAAITSSSTEQWIGTPDSPNLYWGLAALPRPLVSLRAGIDQERTLPERLFPFLKEAETSTRTAEEWQRLFSESLEQIRQLDGIEASGPTPSWLAQAAMFMLVARGYPIAKADLAAAGFDRERLEKMPVGQVVAIHAARTTRRNFDETTKSVFLPYPQALSFGDKVAKQWQESVGPGGSFGGEVLPISKLLMPALSAVIRAEARAERNLACLQTIEALRMHLAASGGKLPKQLDEITVVPVPNNPATGRPFPYRLLGDQASLEAPALPGEPARLGKLYLIRVRPK